MRGTRTIRIVAGLVAGASSLFAQSTLVVEPGNTSAYQTFASAVAAALDGDTIELRSPAGTQLPVTALVTKSLTVVGRDVQLSGTLTVSVPLGKSFTMRGCRLGRTFPQQSPGFRLELLSSTGRVTIADCRPATSPSSRPYGSISITDCTQVLISNCSIEGDWLLPDRPPACTVTRSTVAFERSVVFGPASRCDIGQSSREGIVAVDSTCSFVSMTIVGGLPDFSGCFGRPAIVATRSNLYVAGPAGLIQHGAAGSPAITLFTSPMELDPALGVTWTGTPAATLASLTSTSVTAAVRGQNASLTLRAPAGVFGMIAVSLPGDRTPIPGFGDLWIDASSPEFYVGVAGIQSVPAMSWLLPVPNDAFLVGLQVRAQSATYDGANWRLTPPAVLIVQ